MNDTIFAGNTTTSGSEVFTNSSGSGITDTPTGDASSSDFDLFILGLT